MWLLFLLTQLLALVTTVIFWWFCQPNKTVSKVILVGSIFIISNSVLFYFFNGLGHERFRIYLIFSILQGFMVYAALLTAIIALIYCKLLRQPVRPKLARLIALAIYVSIAGLAVFNAYSPVVKRLTVSTDKPLAKPMTIALVSDTHLGKWFGNRQIDNLLALINESQPDVVLLAGDIMDDTTIYYDKTNMQARFSKLEAPLGVYAVLGNHDYLGYQDEIAREVTKAGVKVLDDEALLLDGAVWLVGRPDDSDRTRLSAEALLAKTKADEGAEADKPVIFLEHRPSQIEAISKLPIDLHMSGHTHGGQIFPLTTIMRLTRPLASGSKIINDTQFVVSSGFGIGSVPFRLGTRSEIWLITLQPAS